MTARVRITVKEHQVQEVLTGTLNDSKSATRLLEEMPLTLQMVRWGEEYYGNLNHPLEMEVDSDAREEMEIGDIAYWPTGNALCLFFGPTPASTGSKPVAASPVNPLGRMEGDVSVLSKLGSPVEMTVERLE